MVIIEVREIDAGYKGQTGGYVPRTVVTGTGKGYLVIGDTMTAEWLKTAGPEGQAVIDAYRSR